jgi:cytochrome P450
MPLQLDAWTIHPGQFWLRGEPWPEKLVSYTESLDAWSIYGYPEAVAALTNTTVFSNNGSRVSPVEIDPEILVGDFSQMDPPQHRKVRGLVDHAFAPKLITNLESWVNELINESLDEFEGRDGFDLFNEFSVPLPLNVICKLLGVPKNDRPMFHDWVVRMMDETGDFEAAEVLKEQYEQADEVERAFALLYEMRAYWNELAAERRKRPQEDLLSHLVHAELEGERLRDTEIYNIATRLMIGGHHATALLIGNTMMILDAFPEEAKRVRENPSLLPSLIEESLRFLSPFAGLAKVTMTDVEVAGTLIPKDQVVVIWTGAANRDGRQFADPDVFDASRSPNPHLGFGRGVHFCVGRRLARLQARAAVRILMDRFPLLRTDPDNPPVFSRISTASGAEKLPILIK